MAANGILEFQGTEKAIFRGSNSNIVIDTANSSFGVGVDTPTSNLHIVGKTSLQGDLNLVQVSNVANVTVNSNVVTEYTGPHDRPLRKYPEVAMTANSDRGYVASASTTYNNNGAVYPTFAGDGGSGTWLSQDGAFNTNDPYNALNTASLFDGQRGEWIQLQLPNAIRVSYFKIIPRSTAGGTNAAPEDQTKRGSLYGSNDGTNFTKLIDYGDLDYGGASGQNVQTIHVNATEHYKYLRLLCTARYGNFNNQQWVGVGELEYYGHEEGSGSLDTTLKSVYNVPATTGTQLEVYYDAKNYSGSGDVQDETANNRDAEMNATFDNGEIKAFNFSGAYTSNVTTSDHGLGTGDVTYTMSYWFKRTAVAGSYDYIVMLGNGGAYSSILMWINNDYLSLDHGSSALRVPEPIVLDQWYHVAAGHSGGNTPNLENDFIYINGKQVTPVITQTAASFTFAGSKLTLGSEHNGTTEFFDGSIANFRLYSKALNADQVKELYDYQKDYFLGSKSQVTLYKGHLGVGVTEPSGQLELAGDERLQEYPPRGMTTHVMMMEGHGVFSVSASNEYDSNNPAWEAFGDYGTSASSESVWNTPSGLYNTTSGLYTGSTTTAGINGEWIQMKAPYKLKISTLYLDSYLMLASGRQPRNFTLLGSNDGNVWEQMKSVVNQTTGYTMTSPYSTSSGGPTHTINSTKYYSYFRIVVTATQDNTKFGTNPDGLAAIGRIKFFGTPGPTTLDKGSLSLTRNLDVPRVSRYDVDTETPRPEKLVLDLDTTVNSSPTDISGNGNHGTFNGGAYYSTADKAFVFDGTDDYLDIPSVSGVGTGAWVHSKSFWFKLHSSTDAGVIFLLGRNGSTKQIAVQSNGSGQFQYYIYGCNSRVQVNGSDWFPDVNRWYHCVTIFKYNENTATGGVIEGREMYIDGVKQTLVAVNNQVSLDLDSSEVRFGNQFNTSNYLDYELSNPKLYNVALEPSEVQKLYRLGRTGRSMVISDTAVGIGKAPEAQLDVRGVARLERLLINGTLGHVLLEEAEIYYDPSRAECQDRTEFMNNTVRDIKGNYHGTKTGISEYNQFWGQDADNSGIATNNNIDLRRDWTAMVWMKPAAGDNLGVWKILGHGTSTANGGLHFVGADGSRIRAGMYGNDIDVGTATGMSRRREWNCMTFAYYHNNGVAGGCDKMIYQNERLVGHQQGGIGDGYHFTGTTGGSGASNGHQPYSASPNILRFGAGYSYGTGGKQYQHIGPCIFIPRFLSTQEVRSLYRFFAMRFARVGADS